MYTLWNNKGYVINPYDTYKIEKRPVHSAEHTGRNQLVVFIGRLFVQLFHQMRDDSIATEGVILFVDIPHDLAVGDRIVSVLHMPAVALIKAIPEQRDHRLSDRLLIVISLLQFLELTIVLLGDYTQRENTKLLYPVLLDDLLHAILVHRHSPFILVSRNLRCCNRVSPAPRSHRCCNRPRTAPTSHRCCTIQSRQHRLP